MSAVNMGFEYKVHLTATDFAALGNEAIGMSLDSLLREAPGFVSSDGTMFSYSATQDSDSNWLETIHIQDDGLWLTLYSRGRLLNYVMNSVLKTCGQLHIEDG